MRCVGVLGMRFAACPNFVEQEGAWAFGGTVEVIGHAAVFFACGTYQCAQFGLQEHFLAIARAQLDDEGNGVFGELRARGLPGFVGTSWSFLCFALRHGGRDSTPRRPEKPNSPEQ